MRTDPILSPILTSSPAGPTTSRAGKLNNSIAAGAWVGFNDARVTIRSNYWGQGGHNALRLVGAFFQQGQKAGLIDTQAVFPQVERDPPVVDPATPAPEAPVDAPGSPASAAATKARREMERTSNPLH